MTDNLFEVNWSQLDSMNYVSSLMYETGVIWLGRKVAILDPHCMPITKISLVPPEEMVILFNNTNTLTSQCTIRNCYEWNQFVQSCYVLRCKDNKSWKDSDGEKMNLKEWSEHNRNNSEFCRTGSKPFTKDVVFTIYDSIRCKRLIIDGTHRATILTNECENKNDDTQIQPMRIWDY